MISNSRWHRAILYIFVCIGAKDFIFMSLQYHLDNISFWVHISIILITGIKLTDTDQDLYKNFPLVISERWQSEVADTVFDTINHDCDKLEHKRKAKHKKYGTDEKDSDCILHGYIKKQGGPFSSWQIRYAKLYPNRLELYPENSKPELTFMDQIDEINTEFVQVKSEQCIVIKTKDGRVVLTNPDEIGLKEWSISLRTALKCSHELLSGLKKAGKIYGTTADDG